MSECGFDRLVVNRVAVIGLGLVGGSLALAWRRAGAAGEVVGIDRDHAALEGALAMDAVDLACDDIAAGLDGADVVVLAVPVRAVAGLAEAVGSMLGPGSILTDVCSTKVEAMAAMCRAAPPGVAVIGGHPLAGSERAGIGAADPYLFENAFYILTPAPGTPAPALERLEALVRGAGANPVRMSPEQHDRLVAAISHLPQLVAVTLVNAVGDLGKGQPGLLGLAAGGFRDTTRIASSGSEIWRDILLTNRGPVAEALVAYRAALDGLAEAVSRGDGEAIARDFDRARGLRDQVPARTRGLLPAVHELVAVIPDRPGVIGHLATALGEAEINISDIEILRVREGEGGTIRLGFATPGARDGAIRVLEGIGYRARPR